jgi:signal transduction histidine kinase
LPDLRVLLLDDDPDFHEIFQDYLELAFPDRMPVFQAETSIERAVARATTDRYTIIYIDYRLGKVTGIEAIRDFSLNHILVPMVLLTGYDDAEIEEQALAAGAIDYLKKNDIGPTALARSIRYAKEASSRRVSLIYALNQLTHALDVKSLFLSNMSHEMRTPLNGIFGFAQMLAIPEFARDTEKVLEYSEAIKSSCDRLLELVDGLLTLQEDSESTLSPRMHELDVNSFFKGLCGRYRSISEGRDIAFRLTLPEESTTILSDPDALQLALAPILSNAVKFTESGGSVSVTVSVGDTLDILVVDTGCGMSLEILQQAERPFFMRDNSFARRHEGAGIGLSVARTSLTTLHGTSSIKSEEGVGTEVSISIPIKFS